MPLSVYFLIMSEDQTKFVLHFKAYNLFLLIQVDDSFLSGNPMRGRDGRCGRDDFIPATPTDSAKTPSDLHMIHIKQEMETMVSVIPSCLLYIISACSCCLHKNTISFAKSSCCVALYDLQDCSVLFQM